MKRKRTDTSMLPYGIKRKLRDDKYRKSFKGQSCGACGINDETIVGAHIRTGEYAGIGTKPDDNLIIGLCHACHLDQGDKPGAEWYLENIVKPQARRNYEQWKQKKQ